MKKIILISEGPLMYLPGVGFIKGPGEFYLRDELADMGTKLLNVYGYCGKYKIVDIEGPKSSTESIFDNIKGINMVINEEYKDQNNTNSEADTETNDKSNNESSENIDNIGESDFSQDVTENIDTRDINENDIEELKNVIDEFFSNVTAEDIVESYVMEKAFSEMEEENTKNVEDNVEDNTESDTAKNKSFRKRKKKSDTSEV